MGSGEWGVDKGDKEDKEDKETRRQGEISPLLLIPPTPYSPFPIPS
ncbi:hypothetical protein PI95_006005 [Hassallia byssoidea VB512170]|uniref:Uncharacterized protein n=1 Tax=Hassallia byssoidea VB512170 TaxID=1304833 RepID=A0A846H3F3_9CYAN|nr:hypothetical protein [Hassalia byssoidea]NEU72137.1 hypothetical protein [Hassalia byssoidea VB512170]